MNPNPEMKRIRILLADDDVGALVVIHKLLQSDFEVVEMVQDGSSLVEAAFKWRPDVIVSDISMPKLNGIQAARKILESLPGIKFIFLTMHASPAYRRAALSLGASGYVLKAFAREELTKSVRAAFQARP
jgi:DNA-binding NarL/FixJ family response regulator